jgi:hypothetical protein
MAEVTLRFDELEYNDVPSVCMACGARREVDFAQRRFLWRPLFAYGLVGMVMTRRVTVEIPLCPEHGGPRFFAHQRFAWWGLKTVAIGGDRITIGGVAEEFADALHHYRMQRDRGEIMEPPPRRRGRVAVGRGPGGTGTVFKVFGILIAVMVSLVALMAVGMFTLMAVGLLFLPKAPPLPTAPPAVGPAANAGAPPLGPAVALLAVAPQAGGPGAVPWAPLALAIQKEPWNVLDDADLDKILLDLIARDPGKVAAAARRLDQAAPNEARRQETAQVLVAAMKTNPFPAAKDAAAEALGKWGSAGDAPELIGMLADRDPNTRAAAMTALAGIKDEGGAVAVAQRLADLADRRKARQALEAMGPTAQTGVAPLVLQGDPLTRVEACGVLQAIGTQESLAELEVAARDPNQLVARAAAEAVTAINNRTKRNSHE